METVHFVLGGRVGIMLVTHAMFKKTGARPINTQDFVDIPRSIKGVAVAVLADRPVTPGKYTAVWNARGMPSGVYFYTLRAEQGFIETKKVLLLK